MYAGKRNLNDDEKSPSKRLRLDRQEPSVANYKKTAIELAMEETEEYERKKETEQRRLIQCPRRE